MDPLNMHVFESLQKSTTGDAKIDDTNLNFGGYLKGILNAHSNEIAGLEARKNHFSGEGFAIETERIRKETLKKLKDIEEKASWKGDIEQAEAKFDVIEDKADLRILIEESREREVRGHMRELKDDLLTFTAEYGHRIETGDPTVVGAIINSPFDIPVDPGLLKMGVEKMRLRKNPTAASRLKALIAAQDIHNDLFSFAVQEIGADAEGENLLDLAIGQAA